MDVLNYIKSNKKKSGLIFSLIIIVIGVIPLVILTFRADPNNPYTIEEISLTSEDGTKLQALILTPDSFLPNDPGVVVAHGFCGNKAFMLPLSIELVKRGFIVISIDFRGHGSSEGHLIRTEFGYERLNEDMEAAINYLKNSKKCGDIGLVGHSMGGGTALRVAEDNPSTISAVVNIGGFNTGYNFSKIHNLLLAYGLHEQIITNERAIAVLKEYTNLEEVSINKRYGDFTAGNATKAIIGPAAEHLAEVLEPIIIYEMVQWFEQAFNGQEADDVILTIQIHQTFYFTSIIGVISLSFVCLVYLSNFLFTRGKQYPERNILSEKVKIPKLVGFYILSSAIGLLASQLFDDVFAAVLPVSMGQQLFPVLFVTCTFAIINYYYFILRRSENLNYKDLKLKLKEMCSPYPERSILFGFLASLISIIAISSISHWSSQTSFNTAREIGAIFGMAFLFIPFFILKEFYFRTIQGKIKYKNRIREYFAMTAIGIIMEITILIPVMIFTWKNSSHTLSFLALSVTAMMLILMIQQILVTWVYQHSGRNILGSAVFLSIFYAWIIVSFFPFGIN